MTKLAPSLWTLAFLLLVSAGAQAQQTPAARQFSTPAAPPQNIERPPAPPQPEPAPAPTPPAVTPASGELIDATDPEKLAAILKGFGIARIETSSSTGNPKIGGRADGKEYQLYFYGCTDHKNCRSVQFWAYWDKDVAADKLNVWNKDTRYGKVYSDDDKDLVLEYDINMISGVSELTFEDSAEIWVELLSSVDKELVSE